MTALALIIAIIALVIAYVAFTKSGGSIKEMTCKVEDLHLTTESLRNKIAEILESLEKKVRGEEKKSSDQPEDKSVSH
jgi:hypothetical protein